MFFDANGAGISLSRHRQRRHGTFHVLSTDEDGHVYAYGGNSFGQLGSGEAGENAFYYGGMGRHGARPANGRIHGAQRVKRYAGLRAGALRRPASAIF